MLISINSIYFDSKNNEIKNKIILETKEIAEIETIKHHIIKHSSWDKWNYKLEDEDYYYFTISSIKGTFSVKTIKSSSACDLSLIRNNTINAWEKDKTEILKITS